MTALAVWLTGWRGRLAGAAACLLLGFCAGWSARDRLADRAALQTVQAEANRRVAAADRSLAVTARSAAISDVEGRALETRQAELRIVYRTLIREVPTYVTAKADRRCDVPVGFVRLHDAAAAGARPAAVSDSAAGADDAPSGLALSAVAATVADNYGTCAELRQQVIGWQAWYQAQRAAWPGP